LISKEEGKKKNHFVVHTSEKLKSSKKRKENYLWRLSSCQCYKKMAWVWRVFSI